MLRRPLIFILALLLLAPLVPTSAAASPSLYTMSDVNFKELANAILDVPEVKNGVKDGQTLRFQAPGTDVMFEVQGGRAVSAGPGDATHTLHSSSADAFPTVLNSYDRANTLMMMLKDKVLVVKSKDTAVKAAAKGIASGAMDDQLQTTPPAAGKQIHFRGFDGELEAHTGTDFKVTLGDSTFAVNKYGGLYGVLPSEELTDGSKKNGIDLSDGAGTTTETDEERNARLQQQCEEALNAYGAALALWTRQSGAGEQPSPSMGEIVSAYLTSIQGCLS